MAAVGQGLIAGLLIVLAVVTQRARMEDRQPSSRLHLVSQTAEPSYRLLLRLARSGAEQIGSLTKEETAQVCRALLQHYAQMGIG